MGKLNITHEIRCNADTFWKIFFDKDFNTRLYTQALGFPAFAVVDQKDEGDSVSRKVTATPKMEVPAAVQKLFGPGFGYQEEGSMKRSEGIWRWKMTPNTMADKLFTSGTVRIEAVGSDKVKRIADVNIEAKIFAVGGLIESTAEKQIRDGWDKSAVFMNKFIEESAK